jgi:hypothetical protein
LSNGHENSSILSINWEQKIRQRVEKIRVEKIGDKNRRTETEAIRTKLWEKERKLENIQIISRKFIFHSHNLFQTTNYHYFQLINHKPPVSPHKTTNKSLTHNFAKQKPKIKEPKIRRKKNQKNKQQNRRRNEKERKEIGRSSWIRRTIADPQSPPPLLFLSVGPSLSVTFLTRFVFCLMRCVFWIFNFTILSLCF